MELKLTFKPGQRPEDDRFLVLTPSGRTHSVPLDEAMPLALRRLAQERPQVQKDHAPLRITRAGVLAMRAVKRPQDLTLEDLGL